MNFLYPSFLFALAALAIPIIIHLFNFRRYKKVYFSNVKFLKEVKEETTSRNRLKHLLVLLSRLLALAALVLAFAQPFIPLSEDAEIVQGAKAVSIYVDNSFSMEALSDDVSLFEKARKKAREVVEAYGLEDRFQLITNDFLGKHQRMSNKEEFLTLLEEINISPNVQSMSSVLDRQKQAFEYASSAQNNAYFISDFQKNVVDLDLDTDTLLKVYMIPLQSVEQRNVFIDSIWFDSPVRALNTSSKLLVRINNKGDLDVENSRMTLRINDQVKSLKDFSVKADAQVVDTINFTVTETGWHKAEMSISDYPIEFDNNYFFTFEVRSAINILAINQSNSSSPYLNALFKGNENFVLQNQSVNQLDYAKLPKNQMIILNEVKSVSSGLSEALTTFVKNGGNLLVFPNTQAKVSSMNDFLKGLQVNTYTKQNRNSREVADINLPPQMFNDVFVKIPRNLDLLKASASMDMTSYSNTGEENLLQFRGGSSALSKYNVGDGIVYLSALSLNAKESNLPSHGIFLPLVYKMALISNNSEQLAYTIGNNESIGVENKTDLKDAIYKVQGEEEEFIPEQKVVSSKLWLKVNNQLQKAGIYQLHMNPNEPLHFFGFNFNRLESILDYFDLETLKNRFNLPHVTFLKYEDDLTTKIEQLDRGVELWKYFLWAALGFLLLEVLLLRLWKK